MRMRRLLPRALPLAFVLTTGCGAERSTGPAGVRHPRTGGHLAVRAEARGPLIIIDGAPLAPGAVLHLDAEAVGAIEVLKGSAATRLYGAGSAAGVIRISTKRPSAPDVPAEEVEHPRP